MPGALLDALLDSWDRNNTILVNLLNALPDGAMDVRPMDGSPTVGAMFMHLHYVRLIFIAEDVPECAVELPADEWRAEPDRARMAKMLNESAAAVRDAVKGRIEAGKEMDVHYDHPILFVQHMIWHEGYHQGQIKLALKAAGQALENAAMGPLTWRVWMNKTTTPGAR